MTNELLKDKLFSVVSEEVTDNTAVVDIRLNAGDAIYSGHFPGFPVTPGVCLIQIAVDLFAHLHQQAAEMPAIKSVKFLKVINPTVIEMVNYRLTWSAGSNGYDVSVIISGKEEIFSKINMQIKFVS